MYHHHHQQQNAHHSARVTPAQVSDLAQRSTSEIEAFRARQRMQLRYGHTNTNNQQQVFPYSGSESSNNNLTDAHYSERMHDIDDDNRVRKLSLTKRRQQLHHHHHQQQSLPNQQRVVKMPNFGGVRQFDAYHSDTCTDMPSPVPFASHAMFNAFDYGHAPETFGDESSHSHQSDHAMHAHGSDSDEKSLWRRRFAASDAHERRSPKLGKVALWDSPCGLDDDSDNDQFSHELQHIHPFFQHHQHLYQYEMQ